MALRAIVRGGQLHLDEPVDLPDGTELSLVLDDDEPVEMSAAEFAQLDKKLTDAARAIDSGHWVDGAALLARLEAKSR